MMLQWIESLATAAVCGAALGMEREWMRKAAGLRTNTLICLGAALFTIISIEIDPTGQDHTRIAAQIVTGIGFLGAGTILRRNEDDHISGLTSAATIWVVAAIGMVAGSNHKLLAAVATLATLVILTALRRLERWLALKKQVHELEIVLTGEAEGRRELIMKLVDASTGELVYLTPTDEACAERDCRLKLIYVCVAKSHRHVLARLRAMPGVGEVREVFKMADYRA